MPVFFAILFLDNLSLGGRSFPRGQMLYPGPPPSTAVLSCLSLQMQSFLELLVSSLSLFSPPFLLSFASPLWNKKITRLRVTRLTSSRLPTLIKGAKKGELDVFFFFWSNTLHVVSFLAFVAAQPLGTIDTISVNYPITNMLHLQPHLVSGLNGTDEAFPLECFNTLGMLICI